MQVECRIADLGMAKQNLDGAQAVNKYAVTLLTSMRKTTIKDSHIAKRASRFCCSVFANGIRSLLLWIRISPRQLG